MRKKRKSKSWTTPEKEDTWKRNEVENIFNCNFISWDTLKYFAEVSLVWNLEGQTKS